MLLQLLNSAFCLLQVAGNIQLRFKPIPDLCNLPFQIFAAVADRLKDRGNLKIVRFCFRRAGNLRNARTHDCRLSISTSKAAIFFSITQNPQLNGDCKIRRNLIKQRFVLFPPFVWPTSSFFISSFLCCYFDSPKNRLSS
jgi:hypothetical protein